MQSVRSRTLLWLAAAAVGGLLAGTSGAGGAAPAVHHHVAVCGGAAPSREVVEPPEVDAWNLPLDANGEHELILAVHHDGQRYCYRYTLDGRVETVAPAIHVRRGEHFALRIVNDLKGRSPGESVASTAIPACAPMTMPPPTTLHFVGYLNHTIDDRPLQMAPVDTNIHLHGFEGPASEENIFLSTLSTPMHACEYRITIPKRQPPGTYMYHPHAHGTSDVEVSSGLDGAWIVEPDRPQLPPEDDHVLVVRYQIPFGVDNIFAPDETALGNDGIAHEAALPAGSPVPYDPFDPPPWPSVFPIRGGGLSLDPTGCNGAGSEALVDVDGAAAPATLHVAPRTTQLLRIVNGTSDSPKFMQLRDASGTVTQMRVVGIDGIPVSGDMDAPLSQYIAMDRVMLTPMSRTDILLTIPPGDKYVLSTEHFCEGKDAFFQMRHDLLAISTRADAPGAAVAMPSPDFSPVPATIADTPAAKLVAYARANPSLIRRRALTFTEYAFPKSGKIPVHQGFYITDTTNRQFREHPFWPVYPAGATVPANADVVVKKGTIEEWYLINATMESHGFHIHQMSFVQENGPGGIPLTEDTVFVPVGRLLPNKRDPNYPLVAPSITKILLDFRHVPRGTFVFHCHMLFHEDAGMMAIVRVE